VGAALQSLLVCLHMEREERLQVEKAARDALAEAAATAAAAATAPPLAATTVARGRGLGVAAGSSGHARGAAKAAADAATLATVRGAPVRSQPQQRGLPSSPGLKQPARAGSGSAGGRIAAASAAAAAAGYGSGGLLGGSDAGAGGFGTEIVITTVNMLTGEFEVITRCSCLFVGRLQPW
jgi:hypothetical protein